MFSWLKWWFIETKRCKHEPGNWVMREGGMGKAQYCTKCNKCLKLI